MLETEAEVKILMNIAIICVCVCVCVLGTQKSILVASENYIWTTGVTLTNMDYFHDVFTAFLSSPSLQNKDPGGGVGFT